VGPYEADPAPGRGRTKERKVFFDIGPLEMVALVILAVMIFGPDKLPKLIQDATRFIRKVREFSDNAKADIRRELGPEFKDFEFEDLHPKTFVRKHLAGADGEDDIFGLKELKEIRNGFDLKEFRDVQEDVTALTEAGTSGLRRSANGSATASVNGSGRATGNGGPSGPERLRKADPASPVSPSSPSALTKPSLTKDAAGDGGAAEADPPPFDADAT
jgi:sec-independent protein translocase protein TatB